MNPDQLNLAPEGHMWVEDLAAQSSKDLNTVLWLCEEELIQAVKLGNRWAVRVLKTTTTKAGAAIVRDLKAGRDISIGSVIGQYITIDDGKDRERDRQEMIAQTPIRDVVSEARKHLLYTWYVLGGGAVFAIVGIVLSWPIAALMILPAYQRAQAAVGLAEQHGDSALIEEAKQIATQAQATAFILWAVIALIVCAGMAAAGGGS